MRLARRVETVLSLSLSLSLSVCVRVCVCHCAACTQVLQRRTQRVVVVLERLCDGAPYTHILPLPHLSIQIQQALVCVSIGHNYAAVLRTCEAAGVQHVHSPHKLQGTDICCIRCVYTHSVRNSESLLGFPTISKWAQFSLRIQYWLLLVNYWSQLIGNCTLHTYVADPMFGAGVARRAAER